MSHRIQYSQGVRQGCVIAPLLYVTFINPLTGSAPPLGDRLYLGLLKEAFEGGLDQQHGLKVRLRAASVAMSVSVLQYVDDVCLLAPSAAALQANLDIYVKHARKWRYVLAPDKFQMVPFGRGAHGDEEWHIPTPTGVQKVQSGPTTSTEYLHYKNGW